MPPARGLALVPLGLALAPAALLAWAELQIRRAERSPVPPPPGAVLSLHGVSVHYQCAGAGPPVLLLAGFGGSTFSWRHVLPALADCHRLYPLDLPPFGYAERLREPLYTVRWLARLAHAFCQAWGLDQVAVVGHSLGGMVALQLAHDHPLLVRQLALVAPALYRWERLPLCGLLRFPLLARAALYYAFGSPGRIRRALRTAYGNPAAVTGEVVRGYYLPLCLPGTIDAVLAMLASPHADDLPEGLHRITAPTLLIWGERDRIVPLADAEPLRAQLPAAHLRVLPGVGHLPAEERPHEVCNLLRGWLG